MEDMEPTNEPAKAEDGESGFDWYCKFICGVSLMISVGAGAMILPNVRGGFYGGTALILFLVLLVQAVGMLLLLWLPALYCLIRGRLRLSTAGKVLLAVAFVLLGVEMAAVFLIPVTGNC